MEESQNLVIFSKRAERASIGTVGPAKSPAITKTMMKIKKYFLLRYNKKVKKAVCQFVCVLELKLVIFKQNNYHPILIV